MSTSVMYECIQNTSLSLLHLPFLGYNCNRSGGLIWVSVLKQVSMTHSASFVSLPVALFAAHSDVT